MKITKYNSNFIFTIYFVFVLFLRLLVKIRRELSEIRGTEMSILSTYSAMTLNNRRNDVTSIKHTVDPSCSEISFNLMGADWRSGYHRGLRTSSPWFET